MVEIIVHQHVLQPVHVRPRVRALQLELAHQPEQRPLHVNQEERDLRAKQPACSPLTTAANVIQLNPTVVQTEHLVIVVVLVGETVDLVAVVVPPEVAVVLVVVVAPEVEEEAEDGRQNLSRTPL